MQPRPVPARRAVRMAAAVALLALPMAIADSSPAGAVPTLPADFTDQLVTNVTKPTALAFTPDGRVLVATQPGQLRVLAGGEPLPAPAIDLGPRLCSTYERGLLGVAVAPDFTDSHHVFVLYTFRNGSTCGRNLDPYPANRVSRLTLPDTNVIDPASEVVVLDNIPSRWGAHNAGDLHFGADGLLYASVGDGGCRLAPSEDTRCAADNNNSGSLSHLLGKILRVGPDGSIPPTNPYASAPDGRRCGDPAGGVPAGSGPCQETFASGLRNPFRFAVRPGTSELTINDVGQDTWEEIDRGVAGADYGWNLREGHCATGSTSDCGDPGPAFVNPIFDYSHSGGCSSVTGGAFIPTGVWPAPYDGAYLFADYVCGKIFRLAPTTAGGFTAAEFVTGLGASSATSLAFGPSAGGQSMYYTSYANGGEIRRISWTPAGRRPPVASFTTSVPTGDPPVEVGFDAGASSDPDGGALTYRWRFGDGSPAVETATATTTHVYTAAGSFTATLTVRDPDGLESSPASRTVVVGVPNLAPTPQVLAPATTTRFTVGQAVTLKGTATDPEEGTLADGALSWEVLIHHNNHTHPLVPPTAGNDVTFITPPPENLAATTNSYLEIHLTATDSQGLSATVVQRFDPKKVTLTFKTSPDHLVLVVGGTAITTTKRVTSWVGYRVTISAPSPQTQSGRTYRFSRWSDGKAATHTITTPPSGTTYKAIFTRL